jgi:hypothetical protein
MKVSASIIYAAADALLLSELAASGFTRVEAGSYRRQLDCGIDRIVVDADVSKQRFSILISHYPAAMNCIEQLVDCEAADRGFPVGPFLSAVGVRRRECFWPSKSEQVLRVSVLRVLDALQKVGIPWLEKLRDPSFFADEVDPVGALYAAFANERAGRLDAARSLYLEMRRRLAPAFHGKTPTGKVLQELGRQYVFVEEKLGADREIVRRVREFFPDMAATAVLGGGSGSAH